VNEPAPGSGHDSIIDLERRELLSILRSVQDAKRPVSDPKPKPGLRNDSIIDLGRRDALMMLRSVQDAERSVSDPRPPDDIAWLD
jgi:hypothetical protein